MATQPEIKPHTLVYSQLSGRRCKYLVSRLSTSSVDRRSPPAVRRLRMLSIKYSAAIITQRLESVNISGKSNFAVLCAAKGPRPRYPRIWKSKKRIGTISKSQKLVDCIKGLSNVKEEVYGALDSFIAWELEFPLIAVKKALKTLEKEGEWKRIIQVTKWMLSKGQGRTMGSYCMLLNALAQDDRLEEAEELWNKIFSENLESLPRVFFIKMISIYYSRGMHEKLFEVFADMEELGVKPNTSIVSMVGKVFQKLGMLDKYDKLMKKYPPPTWEYRYFKGKRVKVQIKNLKDFDDGGDKGLDDFEEEPEINSNELEEEGVESSNKPEEEAVAISS
ncbi:pentatricopeptide repeat-containing protein At4g21190 isoform X2 [Macadamia integrifolia]|uniref:pentatricopeptide repeat-containing protein At4g21190 isoform X2 n=1 Tax=Macadamia integrifolia TaxID=60698 RepID=UPI001C4F3D73|nr:pentatricopeptide repeat-containing protein At4g21190 isoform X2 [Macadamia integrifolia]